MFQLSDLQHSGRRVGELSTKTRFHSIAMSCDQTSRFSSIDPIDFHCDAVRQSYGDEEKERKGSLNMKANVSLAR